LSIYAFRFRFLGEYTLLPDKIHDSATCQVRFAVHHQDDKKIPVALKFMKEKTQFDRELEGRKMKLDSRFVVEVMDHHDSVDLQEEAQRRGLYCLCLVMPRGDRTLLDVLKHEHLAPNPDEVHWAEVAAIAKQLLEALQHLHDKELMHGDLKP
jgi:serine/threonine protein kinase